MNTAVWVVQILLAIGFVGTGFPKIFQSYDQLAKQMGWVHDLTLAKVRGIGVLEVLGAVGLVLPVWVDFWPWMTRLWRRSVSSC